MPILNLTQHAATPSQIKAGVVDLSTADRKALSALLTFVALPTDDDLAARAADITAFAVSHQLDGPQVVMVGCASWFAVPLITTLSAAGFKAVQSFSARNVVDTHMPDGTVTKTVVFDHLGFI